MVYYSLFDRIVEADPNFSTGFAHQKYKGTLESVLDETGKVLEKGCGRTGFEGNGYMKNVLTLALHPPRIIRAILDYKVQNPGIQEAEFLLRDAIQLGLDVYRGNPNTAREIEKLRERIIKNGNRALLDKILEQPYDRITWDATDPSRSIRTTANLIGSTGGDPILFVALAHGGVAAGMDIYLRYCDKTGEKGSAFYVARFSTLKLRDVFPQLVFNKKLFGEHRR